jgi:hypothetical protein
MTESRTRRTLAGPAQVLSDVKGADSRYPPLMSAALEWASTFRERMRTVVPIALSSEMPPG